MILLTHWHSSQDFLFYLPLLNVSGMVPWKLFIPKFNTDSSVLKAPQAMLPLKLLLDKLMIWKVVILQIQGGISPVSLLFAIKIIHRLRRSWKWLLKQIGS